MAHIMRGIMQRGGLNVPGQRDQGKAQNGGKDRGNKAAGGLRLGSHCSHGLLLAVTPDDLFQVSHAWQVSWLTGRCLCPPSPTEWSSGTLGTDSPLTVAGAASVSGCAALTEFPVRFHTQRGACGNTKQAQCCTSAQPRQGSFTTTHAPNALARKESRADRKCRPRSTMPDSQSPVLRPRFAGSGGGPPVKCPAKPDFVSYCRPGARRYLRRTRQKLSGHA